MAYETFAILAGNLAFFHPLHTDIDNNYMHHSHIHLDTVPHTKVEFWSLLKRRWWTNDLDFTELGGSPWKFISQPTRVLQHGKWKQWFKCAGVQPRPSAKRNLLLSNSTIAITSNHLRGWGVPANHPLHLSSEVSWDCHRIGGIGIVSFDPHNVRSI